MDGLVDKTKGRIKQAVGALTGNEELRQEGKRDERQGRVEGALEDVKDAVKGAVKDTKRAIKDAVK